MNDRTLPIKELADAVGRCRWYIWAACKAGFRMPQRRARPSDWYEWERANPDFCASRFLTNGYQQKPTDTNT